jgi:hypothetical protein
VQPLDSSLEDLIPTTLLGKGRVDDLEFGDGVDGTRRHQANLSLFQVATLRDHDQVVFIGRHLVRTGGAEVGAEARDQALREEVPLL